jgi:hypothetical protein
MDFNKLVVYALGITAFLGVMSSISSFIVFRAEFTREMEITQKTAAEHKVREIEKQICEKSVPILMPICLLKYARYEALREREDFQE